MSTPLSSREFFKALKEIVELPKYTVSMNIQLEIDSLVVITCTYHATSEIDVTNLGSKAREYSRQAREVTQKFHLVKHEP